MKADIHPGYGLIKATCSCGNVIETKSTLGKDIVIEVCSACHPIPFILANRKFLTPVAAWIGLRNDLAVESYNPAFSKKYFLLVIILL